MSRTRQSLGLGGGVNPSDEAHLHLVAKLSTAQQVQIMCAGRPICPFRSTGRWGRRERMKGAELAHVHIGVQLPHPSASLDSRFTSATASPPVPPMCAGKRVGRSLVGSRPTLLGYMWRSGIQGRVLTTQGGPCADDDCCVDSSSTRRTTRPRPKPYWGAVNRRPTNCESE